MSRLMVDDFAQWFEEFAPRSLAEEWDNVGLLVGDRARQVQRVMTCLTLSPDVAREAVNKEVDLIISHHPLPFRPLKQITCDQPTGRVLWDCIRAGISIYSPHTAFDSARQGINQRLAELIGMVDISPLKAVAELGPDLGSGRRGRFAPELHGRDLIQRVSEVLSVEGVQVVGDIDCRCRSGALACGAAGSFLSDAITAGCDVFLTGETNFHTCLEARTAGILMILPGHYATERFALEQLAGQLASEFSGAEIFASEVENDPIRWEKVVR